MKVRAKIQRYAVVLSEIQSVTLWRRFLFAVITLMALCRLTSAIATTYEYDGNGRLRSATNTSGDAAYYDYDDRGNLVRIKRAVAQLGISSFTPNNGSSGIQVLIKGAGFASTTVDNDVRFNGVAAPVLTASANQLLVMVPQNATTGKISVTANGVTAISTDDFQVSQLGVPPVVTGFTPSAGTFGTTVTISGTNLNPYPGASTVEINGVYVPATYIDDVQATVVIPPYVGTGPLTITTPFGRAVTTDNFYVVPVGMNPSTVSFNAPIALNAAPQAATLTASFPNAAYYFSANDGDYLSIQASAFSSAASATYSVLSPTQGVVASGTISSASPTVHLPEIRSVGTYSIYFSGGTSAPQFSFFVERNQVIAIDGAAAVVPVTSNGQRKRLMFVAQEGQDLGIGLANLIANGDGNVNMILYAPDGSTLIASNACAASWGGCEWNVRKAPMSGTYGITITPTSSTQTFSFSVLISNFADVGLTIDGGSASMPLLRRGQSGWYRFDNTVANQVATLRISGMTPTPSGKTTALTIYNPDGTQLATWSGTSSANTFNLKLIQTGAFSVFVHPWNATTMTPQAVVVTNPVASVTVDGSPIPTATTVTGETKRFGFTANQGDNLGVGLSNLIADGDGTVSVSIYRPDGTTLIAGSSCVASWGGCDWNVVNAMPGVYSISVFTSSTTQSVSFTMQVSTAAEAALTIDGDTVSMPLLRRGQSGFYRFENTIPNTLATLQVSGMTPNPSGKTTAITIYNPDGTQFTTWSGTGSLNTFNINRLVQTGTYSVFVDPWNAATMTPQARIVTNLPVTVMVDDSPASTTTTVSGETRRFGFTASQGENLGVALYNLVANGDGAVSVSIYRPDGTALVANSSCVASWGGCDWNVMNAMPGVYGISVFTSSTTQSVSFSVQISRIVGTALTVDGGSVAMPLLKRGQSGFYHFENTTPNTLATLQVSGMTSNPSGKTTAITIYNPDGTQFTTWSGTASLNTFNINKLVQTGTYSVFVDPSNAATMTPRAIIVTNPVVAVTVDGSVASTATTLSGEARRFDFAANQGDSLNFGLYNLVADGTGALTFAIYGPNGTTLIQPSTCQASWNGCEWELPSAPMTGVYGISIFPTSTTQSLSFSLAISNAITGLLTSGNPIHVDLTRRGQDARLTFAGTAGTSTTIRVTPNGSPSTFSKSVGVTIYKPDGSSLSTASITQQYTVTLTNLPTTGTYTVFIDPSYAVAADMNVTRDP